MEEPATLGSAAFHRRISRRRALRVGAGLAAGLAGAALVGCSGNSGASTATVAATAASAATARSSAATSTANAAATTAATAAAQPLMGGTLRVAVASDVSTFDPIATPNGLTGQDFCGYVYPRLVKFTTAVGEPASGQVEGDLIQKWEHPDDLTYILHVRPGMKWDRRAPTNGRAVNASDVVGSWKYYAAKSIYRGDLVHSVNPSGAIDDMTLVDDMTVKMALAVPDAAVLPISATWSALWQVPAEALNGGFDLANVARGAGPFTLTDYKRGISYTYQKNPDYYDAPRPYVDTVAQAIIPASAQVEAQFTARHLDYGIPEADIVTLHKQLPGSRIDLYTPNPTGANVGVSLRPNSPFLDTRVRQAMNMLIDRNAIIDVMSSPKEFENLGLKVGRYWNSPLPPGYGPFWLDPTSSAFGSSAKYLQHNVADAKKLLAAANFPIDQTFPLTFTSNAYGRYWPTLAQTIMSMLADGGIKMTANGIDYATKWVPNYLRAKGDFDGVAMWPNGPRSDPGQWLINFFSSRGANNQVGTSFPDLDKKIFAQQTVSNHDQRVAAIHEVQQYIVENAIAIPIIANGGIDFVDLSWQGLHGRDRQAWGGAGISGTTGYGDLAAEVIPKYWLDKNLQS